MGLKAIHTEASTAHHLSGPFTIFVHLCTFSSTNLKYCKSVAVYQVITENNNCLKELPLGTNLINYSMIKELSSNVVFRSFSIKFVVEGNEEYVVNNDRYQVRAGEYLLANTFAEGKVLVGSKDVVKGICIDLKPELLSEVVADHICQDSDFPDLSLDTFFNSERFLHNKYATDQTNLGRFLQNFAHSIGNDPYENYSFSNEFYYNLCDMLILDHVSILKQLRSIRAVKHSTINALYRRLCRSVEFINNNFSSDISMKSVALEVGLSEYHFYRLFKATFNVSPYRYLTGVRLRMAKTHLENFSSVSETVEKTGFKDISSFSRVFKKHFGVSPSRYKPYKLAEIVKR